MTITSGVSGALAPTVTDPLHPAHKLSLVNKRQFQCDLCKRYGEGSQHYRCEPCNFDAHTECATAPATLKHVNYLGDFVLYSGPGSGGRQRYCELCGREVLGRSYHIRDTDRCLHPCCAFLPRRVVQDGRAFQLGYHPSGMCCLCRNKSTASLSYRSTDDDGEEVFLHVRCLVDTNNRLTGYQDWVASAPISPGVLGSLSRKKKRGGVMKAASVTFSIISFVVHVATFDFVGAADVALDIFN